MRSKAHGPHKHRLHARENRKYGPTIGVVTQEYQQARRRYKVWLAAYIEAKILNDTYYNC